VVYLVGKTRVENNKSKFKKKTSERRLLHPQEEDAQCPLGRDPINMVSIRCVREGDTQRDNMARTSKNESNS